MMEEQKTMSTVNFGATFMSKVFFFFGLAVAVSALGSYIGLTYFSRYFLANPAITYGLIIVELVLIFTSGFWSKKAPLSYILFIGFALCTGLTLVPILAYLTLSVGGTAILIKALTATALMFGACAIFGHTTHYNLQGMRGFLIMGLFGMIIVSVIGIFMPWSNTFEMVFAGIGVILFSGYTMYDIQRLKHYPENAYIDAAIQLYLDIFNMFLFILRLIMAFDRN